MAKARWGVAARTERRTCRENMAVGLRERLGTGGSIEVVMFGLVDDEVVPRRQFWMLLPYELTRFKASISYYLIASTTQLLLLDSFIQQYSKLTCLFNLAFG